MARYRFYFHPIRYTSFGMAACEAMMLGLPIVALATTEMPTVVENGVTGWIDTSVPRLIDAMHELLNDPKLARSMGERAREVARERFGIARFARDWDAVVREAVGQTANPESRRSALASEVAR
jgi:glycosyltransferase involved in cell wall biosynthesis